MSVNRLLGLWLLCAMCPDFVDGLNCKMDEATLKYTQKKIQRAKVNNFPRIVCVCIIQCDKMIDISGQLVQVCKTSELGGTSIYN